MITLDTDTSDCPGAVCKILAENGKSILVQQDWDAPGIASTFGWNMREVQKDGGDCDHRGTDGTIDCPDCGLKPGTFIEAAMDWIQSNDGATAEDPGYFEEG